MPATIKRASRRVLKGCAPVGESAGWSSDRQQAWRLLDGEARAARPAASPRRPPARHARCAAHATTPTARAGLGRAQVVEEISLAEAAAIAEEIGLPVPAAAP